MSTSARTIPSPVSTGAGPRGDRAGQHKVVPISLDDKGLHVAVADQPSVSIRALLFVRPVIARSIRPGAGIGHPVGHRQQLPGPRRRRPTGPGLRAGRRPPASAAPTRRRRCDHRRRRPGRPGRQPHHHPGAARPGLRRPHRAARTSRAGALPHRRRPQRHPHPPATMGLGLVSRIKIMAGMNIVERRRPQDGQLSTDDRRQEHRRPRGHRRHHLGREMRHADPRQDPLGAAPQRSRHARRTPTRPSPSWSGPRSAWCSAPDRPAAARPPPSTPP